MVFKKPLDLINSECNYKTNKTKNNNKLINYSGVC